MTVSLLPPNASPLERALEAATARVGAVPFGAVPALASPAACPIEVLPWLAWALSVDQWDPAWTEAVKRAAVAGSIREHRRKGTRMAVETVLARYDALIRLVEWFDARPAATPHSFEVVIPLVTAPGVAPGGDRASAATAEAIIRDVARAKPLREHFRVVHQLATRLVVDIFAVARIASFQRQPATLVEADASPAWATYLQTEDGEPIQDETGDFLEDDA